MGGRGSGATLLGYISVVFDFWFLVCRSYELLRLVKLRYPVICDGVSPDVTTCAFDRVCILPLIK